MQLDSAVLYDAVFLLYKALETLNARNYNEEYIDPIPLFCNSTTKYQVGPNITSIMREVRDFPVLFNFLYTKKIVVI